jgi:hypothetical protein
MPLEAEGARKPNEDTSGQKTTAGDNNDLADGSLGRTFNQALNCDWQADQKHEEYAYDHE